MSWLFEDVPRDDAERDARFAPGLDERFGPGNWVKCYQCEPDHFGNPVFHHRDTHGEADDV